MNTLHSIAKSWCTPDSPTNSIDEILSWIQKRNKAVEVKIHKTTLEPKGFWFYDRDAGCICN